ncbi:cardiolipin synthase [Metabacillus herbersteinensis]|uniref:Cardiolipin synthase n=1 Tax=Metabacillus herbersteinensis TaxID=283816 RepID=A0ABV6GFH6_9BACI
MLIIGIVVFTLVVWLRIDYRLGRKDHLQKSKYQLFPLRKSNLKLYIDGQNLYEDLFKSIKNSKHSVHVLFFIVKNDEISHEFLSLLGEKAKQGLEVKLLLDYVGSKNLDKNALKLLKRKGAKIGYTNKPRWPYFFYTLQARNHRKITVIDGKIGFIGGFNIGKEYLGLDPKFGYWRDYHLQITGEGVQDMQTQFLKDWFDSSGEDLRHVASYFPVQELGTSSQQFLSTYGEFLHKYFLSFIREAKREIIICTPYFIPGTEIKKELLKALKRGVQVKIMVPMKADHPLVREAAFPYYGPLILAGCEVFRFYYGFYHAKVIVIDDHTCDIGTANFDKRSLYLNDEMNCMIYDKDFIQNVKKQIYEDFHRSEKLTYEFYRKRSILHRGKETFATLVSHFL